MNSFSSADAYPATLAGQLLKLCSETPSGASRQRMAQTLVRLFDSYEKDPANNNPTADSTYYCESCYWFRIPSR